MLRVRINSRWQKTQLFYSFPRDWSCIMTHRSDSTTLLSRRNRLKQERKIGDV
ncbi:hypothetical protein FQR65_LT01413 [Abscondita terminalis]|nr:hypothetical protein FQR65_LT01413 [Abscondita terminalis]